MKIVTTPVSGLVGAATTIDRWFQWLDDEALICRKVPKAGEYAVQEDSAIPDEHGRLVGYGPSLLNNLRPIAREIERQARLRFSFARQISDLV
jgi:hypothetical protein